MKLKRTPAFPWIYLWNWEHNKNTNKDKIPIWEFRKTGFQYLYRNASKLNFDFRWKLAWHTHEQCFCFAACCFISHSTLVIVRFKFQRHLLTQAHYTTCRWKWNIKKIGIEWKYSCTHTKSHKYASFFWCKISKIFFPSFLFTLSDESWNPAAQGVRSELALSSSLFTLQTGKKQ